MLPEIAGSDLEAGIGIGSDISSMLGLYGVVDVTPKETLRNELPLLITKVSATIKKDGLQKHQGQFLGLRLTEVLVKLPEGLCSSGHEQEIQSTIIVTTRVRCSVGSGSPSR